jgi:hypothetical protein
MSPISDHRHTGAIPTHIGAAKVRRNRFAVGFMLKLKGPVVESLVDASRCADVAFPHMSRLLKESVF